MRTRADNPFKAWAAALLAAAAAASMVVVLSFTSPAQATNAGDLDTSFDDDGRVVFDVFGGVDDSGQAVAIQPDGKIVIAGSWCGFGAGCNVGTFAISRFNPDGSLDSAFGSGGRALVAFPNGRAEATGVAIQTDGKIVAAGSYNDDDGVSDADFALVRLESDGDLDPSFSDDGKVTTTFGGSDGGEAVTIQSNGEIVAAGISYDSFPCGVFDGCYRDFALARYNVNGSLDTTFSGDGKVMTSLAGHDIAWGLAIQDDGKIIAAGENGRDFALARYKASGSLDGSFGGDGRVFTDFGGYDGARGVAIQTDGKIVAAGVNNSSGNDNFALARYNTDGSLNPSFSGDGKVITGFGGDDLAQGASIQADGRIVAAGETNAGGDYDFAIARYHAITDNTPPNTTITSGPSGPVKSTSATFTFVSSDTRSTFQCSLDGASFSTCSSPKSYSILSEGSHLFGVRAIDAAGNVDPTPAQRSFTVDTKAPRVSSVLPTEDATGVARGANVKATFSEVMSASSINTKTVKLFRAGTTTPKAAVVSYDAQTKTATLNPENELRLATKYRAVVDTGTKDLAGNGLDQDQDPSNGNQPMVWFFTIRN